MKVGPPEFDSAGGRTGVVVGLAMAYSNTFRLVTGAFLLGFGLSEIPESIWKNDDWSNRQKVLSQEVANMAVCLDNAHQEFSNAVVVNAYHILFEHVDMVSLCFISFCSTYHVFFSFPSFIV